MTAENVKSEHAPLPAPRRDDRLLAELASAFVRLQRIEELIPEALRLCALAVGAGNAGYFRNHSERIYLSYYLRDGVVYDPARPWEQAPGPRAILAVLADGFTVPDDYLGEAALARTRTVLLDHLAGTTVPEFDRFAMSEGWRYEANIPVFIGERTVGALVLYKRDTAFDREQIELAEFVARHLSLALAGAELAERAREVAVVREREAAALAAAAEYRKANDALRMSITRMAAEGGTDDFAVHVLRSINVQVESVTAAIFTLTDDGHHLQMRRYVRGECEVDIMAEPGFHYWRQPVPVDINDSWGRMRDGEQLWLDLTGADRSLAWPDSIQFHLDQDHRFITTIPMMVAGRAIGFVGLGFRSQQRPSPQRIELARALTDQVTLAAEFTRLADEARRTAVAREREELALAAASEYRKASEALRMSIARMAAEGGTDDFSVQVLRSMNLQVNSTAAAIFTLTEDGRHLQMRRYLRGEHEVDFMAEPGFEYWQRPVPVDLNDAWNRMCDGEQLWLDLDGADLHRVWPESIKFHFKEGHRTVTCIPMLVAGRAIGFVGLGFATTQRPSPQRIELARALTDQVTLAFEFTRLADEARRTAVAREREELALAAATEYRNANAALRLSISRLAAGGGEPDFALHILRSLNLQVGSRSAAIFTLDESRRHLQLRRYVRGDAEIDFAREPGFDCWRRPVPIHATEVWSRLLDGEQLWLEIGGEDSTRLWPDSLQFHLAQGHVILIGLPMTVAGRVLGFVGLGFTSPKHPSPQRVELARALTDQVTLATEFTRLADESRRTAVAVELQREAQVRAAKLGIVNRALSTALGALVHDGEMGAIIGTLLTGISQLTGARASLMFLHEPARARLTLHWAVVGVESLDVTSDERVAAWREPVFTTLVPGWDYLGVDGEAMISLTPVAHRTWPALARWCDTQGHHDVTLAGMRADDRRIGLLLLAFDWEKAELGPVEEDLLRALLHQATLAVQLFRLAEETSRLAVIEERNRLAREIHDGLAQSFTGVLMQAQAIRLRASGELKHDPALRRIEDLARSGLRETRRSVVALREDADRFADLTGSLRELIDQVSTPSAACPVRLIVKGPAAMVPGEVGLHLLRIAQELVGNAIKHAHAGLIEVTLEFDGRMVELRVADDGRGFDPAQAGRNGGFGLSSIQERAARLGSCLEMHSERGCGSRARIAVELSP